MIITKFEDTFIPQTPEGHAYAKEFEKSLRNGLTMILDIHGANWNDI